jgi:hypothetical protein
MTRLQDQFLEEGANNDIQEEKRTKSISGPEEERWNISRTIQRSAGKIWTVKGPERAESESQYLYGEKEERFEYQVEEQAIQGPIFLSFLALDSGPSPRALSHSLGSQSRFLRECQCECHCQCQYQSICQW